MIGATPSADVSTRTPRLHVAFELSNRTWKLGFAVTRAGKIRERNVPATDLSAVMPEIKSAKQHFGLPPEATVVSCYEAGRDGFWLHRALTERGVANVIVEPASILVDRRMRQAKTDRLDLKSLMALLVRYAEGEREVWRTVCVPDAETEDRRRLFRERQVLVRQRTCHTNRLKSLLVLHGIKRQTIDRRLRSDLPTLRGPTGLLGPTVQAQIRRELDRLELVEAQIKEVEKEQDQLLKEPAADDRVSLVARHLALLKGIGPTSAFLLSSELFGWREFKNRKQVGAFVGLTPTPYQSGDSARDQGISKAGSRTLRAVAIQLAWGWLHWQPDSAIAKRFQERAGKASKRLRRISIVAAARQLLCALWRYVEHGVVPEGAVLSA